MRHSSTPKRANERFSVRVLRVASMNQQSTLSRPWVSQRIARALVAGAFALKLAILVWNSVTYNGTTYDYYHHKRRAAAAGLRMDSMSYNPPLYYLPCLPFVEDIHERKIKEGYNHQFLVSLLRHTNLIYLLMFYLCWVYVIIPRLITDWRAATIASVVLLSLPGFQKLAAMTHPDNALAGLAALGIASWLWLRDRHPKTRRLDWAGVLGFGTLVGVVGLTRPFAAVPVFVLCLGGLIALRKERGISLGFFARALVMTVLVGTISLSWYVYRWHETGTPGARYVEGWVAKFRPYREQLDVTHYLTSFYFGDLLREPNVRNPAAGDNWNPSVNNDMSNSYPTIAYSEFWGDHWLYFSSPKMRVEGKRWPKRVLFVVALAMLPLLAWRFLGSLAIVVRRLRAGNEDADADALLLLYLSLGVALYFYWLMGDALLPGVNSPIKFIYNAHLVPVFVTLAFLGNLSSRQYKLWLGYTLLVFVSSLPFVVFWPFA